MVNLTQTIFEDTIPLSNILLDPENPRLPDIMTNQRDTIAELSKVQGSQLVALAKHIVNHGINPADLAIVMPTDDEPRNYYVLDGNRRINTLKVLETPELAEDAVTPASFRKLKKLSDRYHTSPINELKCIVVPSREVADTWIQLRHRGQLEGAGTVEWSGQVAARYDSRRGKRSSALQVIDFLQKRIQLANGTADRIKQGRYPVTTLDRLLNTPYVRTKLGLEKDHGALTTVYPPDELVPGLRFVVEDIGSGETSVSKLKNQKQRIDYINELEDSIYLDEETKTSTRLSLESIEDDMSGKSPKGMKKKRKKGKRQRTTIIPKDCILEIDHHRINAIYFELKKLSADEYPNAAAVMLRVFLELSLDRFLENTIRWPVQQVDGTALHLKILAVAKHLKDAGTMTDEQLAAVKSAANKQSILGPTYRTLHSFIHNYHHAPIPTELRTLWDNLQLFFHKLWP